MTRAMLAQLEHVIRPLRRQLADVAARAFLLLADDSKKMQLVQVDVPETVDGAEHFQPYGISGVPPVGSEGIAVFPNGDRGHPLVFAVTHRGSRPTGGAPGEFTIYNGLTGAKVALPAAGDIVATPAAGRKALIGSASASIPPALATELADLKSRIAAWTPVPNDGGASLKTVFAAWPVPGATKVDVE